MPLARPRHKVILDRGNMKNVYRTTVGLFVIMVIWQLADIVFQFKKFILPSPTEVYAATSKNWTWLLEESIPTLQEITIGFALSVIVGLPIAILLSSSRRLEQYINPILIISQTVPKVAIAPLFVIWFGFGMLPKIVIAFLIAFFPIVVDSTIGLKSVPQDLRDLVASTGASKWRALLSVKIPYAAPSIFGGLKLAMTFSTIGAIVGEFVGTSQGLGYIVIVANGRLDTPLVFSAVILLSIIGLLLYNLVSFLESKIIPWHVSQSQADE